MKASLPSFAVLFRWRRCISRIISPRLPRFRSCTHTLPQIACFDTSFHHTQPEVASIFALPRNLTEEGVRRYGFHGLSYEYIASVLPDVIGPAAAGRAWSLPISAVAPACAHCTAGKA